MKHPFDNYLRALILLRYSQEDIIERIGESELHVAGDFLSYCRRIQAEMCALGQPVRRFLEGSGKKKVSKKVAQMVLWDTRLIFDEEHPDLETALVVLQYSLAREAIEVLALHGLPPSEITHTLNAKYALNWTVGSIECYLFYFWNVEQMRPSEISWYLRRVSSEFLVMQREALMADPQLIRARMGLPCNADVGSMSASMLTQAYHAFSSIMRPPDGVYVPEAREWMRTYSHMLGAFAKMKDSLNDSEDELLNQLGLALEEDVDQRIMPMDELSDGEAEEATG